MIKNYSLAIIEDESDLLKSMTRVLKKKGYTVHPFTNSIDFLEAHNTIDLDIILTDKNLPKVNGLELTQKIRARNKTMPIFMITGKGSVKSSILAYESGTDAFITKPFNYDVLDAKIRRALTKQEDIKNKKNIQNKILFKMETSEFIYKSNTIALTPFEFKILKKLYQNKSELIRREELLSEGESRSLDVHISALRKKLTPLKIKITTIKGKGYRAFF